MMILEKMSTKTKEWIIIVFSAVLIAAGVGFVGDLANDNRAEATEEIIHKIELALDQHSTFTGTQILRSRYMVNCILLTPPNARFNKYVKKCLTRTDAIISAQNFDDAMKNLLDRRE